LLIPRVYRRTEPISELPPSIRELNDSQMPVLLVEDNYETRLIYEKYLQGSEWHIVAARSLREAGNVLRNLTPRAIVLDVLLEGEETWNLLARLKSDPLSQSIPIFVVTAVEDEQKAVALGADAYALKPIGRTQLLDTLRRLAGHVAGTVLLVDDEDVSRYLLRQVFGNSKIRFLEAENGVRGLELARAEKPDLIVTDLAMPEMDGFELVERIGEDEHLRNVPVIVATSKQISSRQISDLSRRVAAVMSKELFRNPEVAGELRETLTRIGLRKLIAQGEAA
jgi:CheY-like chemotaxis protein